MRDYEKKLGFMGGASVLAVGAVIMGMSAPAMAADDVVSYRGKAPSAQDLIKSFTGSGAAKKTSRTRGFKPKTRGIRFNDAPTETAAPQEAAPVKAAAPAETAVSAQQPQAAPQAAPQPAPQATAAAGDCPATGTAVALEIKFTVNSAVLEADAYRNLRQMAEAMNSEELRACRFVVEGHTDASGNSNYNMKLSRLRANSVKNYLMSTDIDAKRLVTKGKGSHEPLNPRNKYAPENRRVQFRITGG